MNSRRLIWEDDFFLEEFVALVYDFGLVAEHADEAVHFLRALHLEAFAIVVSIDSFGWFCLCVNDLHYVDCAGTFERSDDGLVAFGCVGCDSGEGFGFHTELAEIVATEFDVGDRCSGSYCWLWRRVAWHCGYGGWLAYPVYTVYLSNRSFRHQYGRFH